MRWKGERERERRARADIPPLEPLPPPPYPHTPASPPPPLPPGSFPLERLEYAADTDLPAAFRSFCGSAAAAENDAMSGFQFFQLCKARARAGRMDGWMVGRVLWREGGGFPGGKGG